MVKLTKSSQQQPLALLPHRRRRCEVLLFSCPTYEKTVHVCESRVPLFFFLSFLPAIRIPLSKQQRL